jgi:multidrug efflux pump subunit AcrA (membrane-fusion protein)
MSFLFAALLRNLRIWKLRESSFPSSKIMKLNISKAAGFIALSQLFWAVSLQILRLRESLHLSNHRPANSCHDHKTRAASAQNVVVDQPANVSAYYQIEIFPRVAGTIKTVEKALGDKVSTGEALVQIEPLDGSGNISTITSPWNGVVSARLADPGLFVANAALVPGVNSLLTIERNDIVTISMSVPEAYVRYLSKDALAEIRMDALPGMVLRSRPSRIAPSLNSGDRTLSVEVDIFNGTADEFTKFVSDAEAAGRSDLKGRLLPVFPEGLPAGRAAGLLPGMYGMMKLTLSQPNGSLLIPSNAIMRDGGLSYLFINENGAARRRSIVIQSDDGISAAVQWSMNGVNQELSSNDEIILSNQNELQDGSPIITTLSN